MTHARSRRQWQARVAEYNESGMTMGRWCERNGFRVGQLRYWLRKSREMEPDQSWACLDLIDDDSAGSPPSLPGTPSNAIPTRPVDTGISVRIGTACVEVRPGFDPSLLSEVLRVVTSTC
jgi:hypothetical protein